MKVFAAVIFSLFFSTLTFAATDIPTNLQVGDVSDTSISLDWDDSDGAMGYYIYYGTKTGSGGTYEMEGIDLIEKSEFTLEKLIPETKYFIAISSVDEFATESEYSQEVEYTTLKVGQKNTQNTLRITEVGIKDETTLELLFSLPINSDVQAPLDFRLEEISTGKEISIDISEVDSTNQKNVIALLGEKLTQNTRYKLTVLDIQDTSGNTIEAGINAFLNFTTPLTFQTLPVEKLTTDIPELNAAPGEESSPTKADIQNTPILVGNNAGVTISSSSMSGSTVQVAQVNEKLPHTGPSQWILLIISLLFGGVIYYMNQRKIISQK